MHHIPADSQDPSPLSFHAARIQALQRSRVSANTGTVASTVAAPVLHPLISDIIQQLGDSANNPLSQRWHHISELTTDLSANMSLQTELQNQLTSVMKRVDDLKQELNAMLQEAQDAAEQELSQARARAEMSRLTHSKLNARLQLV
jgi:methyl-accepting chemotaxis protein